MIRENLPFNTEVRFLRDDGSVCWEQLRLGSLERDAGRLTVALDASELPDGEIERDFLRSLGLGLASGRVGIVAVMPVVLMPVWLPISVANP